MSQTKGFSHLAPYLKQQQILDSQEYEYGIKVITPP